jgi:hypothetical protein
MFRSPVEYAICLCSLSVLLAAAGCTAPSMFYQAPPPPEMLGTKVDQLNQIQEENAELSKFVIYQHEFELNKEKEGVLVAGVRLNEYGEDHVRRIAENVRNGASYPVVIERSQTSAKAGTKYNYPVHLNPDLDMKRREAVVLALGRMGVADADTRVVVAPAFAQPLTGNEAQGAYATGISGWGGGMGGMGGGMGGMGGMGGGFGGGWF